MIVMGIDPGLEGAFVTLEGSKLLNFSKMPLGHDEKGIDFAAVCRLLNDFKPDHIYLERAVAFRQGVTSAFNYGKGVAAIEIAIQLSAIPCTQVMPAKWTKFIHQGIKADLEPKVKSAIALERLRPKFKDLIPKGIRSGKYHDGILDALLIALYGQHQLT